MIFSQETDLCGNYVPLMTWAMLHFCAFVANKILSRIRAFLGLFCPDFYSDIEDFAQILCMCRYLPKKLAAKTSAPRAPSLAGRLEQFMHPWETPVSYQA